MFPLSPISDQAKIVSEPRLFSSGVIFLEDLWVLFYTACHKAVFHHASQSAGEQETLFSGEKYSSE